MSEKRKKALVAVAAAFAVYGLAAARPIPPEMNLAPRWLSSLESGEPVAFAGAGAPADPGAPLPFALGGAFGYVGGDGRFILNRAREGLVSLSPERWAEFGAEPESVTIRGPSGGELAVIDRPGGYPFFIDGRAFVVGRGQDSVSEIDDAGGVMWTFEFPGIITSLDAAAGLLLAGTLDGAITLVDGAGGQAFSFEPGGSRLPVILGSAISRDGSRIAIVSGVDSQRFIVLERFGAGAGDYRVVYHEFLGEGFRRPVHVAFIDGDRRVVFERRGGLGIYDAPARLTRNVDVSGELRALDGAGGGGMLFAVFSGAGGDGRDAKRLVGIRTSGRAPAVAMMAPFRSEDSFLGRIGAGLVVGGGRALAAFDLGRM